MNATSVRRIRAATRAGGGARGGGAGGGASGISAGGGGGAATSFVDTSVAQWQISATHYNAAF